MFVNVNLNDQSTIDRFGSHVYIHEGTGNKYVPVEFTMFEEARSMEYAIGLGDSTSLRLALSKKYSDKMIYYYFESIGYVYMITNKLTGMRYIGSTLNSLSKRQNLRISDALTRSKPYHRMKGKMSRDLYNECSKIYEIKDDGSINIEDKSKLNDIYELRILAQLNPSQEFRYDICNPIDRNVLKKSLNLLEAQMIRRYDTINNGLNSFDH